jgi:class 3 adenylate cyclase
MALSEDLQANVTDIFKKQWQKRNGTVVPESKDLALGNDAVLLNATILYADMTGSTNLVDAQAASLAAEVYKSYMECAARIIKAEGGTITAYDGDRVMAVFISESKNSTAAKTALKINWAVSKIINPSLKVQYGAAAYQMSHSIGIDTSEIMVSRIGVRNDNDLVWVGRAANYAAKLTDLPGGYAYITDDVFSRLLDTSKYGGKDNKLMWEKCTWEAMNKMTIHRSSWEWRL